MRSSVKLLVLFAIVAGLFLVLYPVVQRTRNPKGPPGAIIPAVPPDEANRVAHQSGLSIVAPTNWDQIREQGNDHPAITIAARGIPGTRLKSVLSVKQCNPPAPQMLGRFIKVKWGSDVAWEAMTVDRPFDDSRSTYELYISNDRGWWHIEFIVATNLTELPQEVRQYIETIKFPQPSAN